MNVDLEGKIILVTGAARGLGLAYAKSLLSQGAIVCLHDGGVDKDGANPDASFIDRVVTDLDEEHAHAFSGLLNSKEDCRSLVDAVVRKFGRIDSLIHNAGIVLWCDTVDVQEADFHSSSVINHEAAFWLCQAALPSMREQGFGRIVLTSSGWAMGPYPGSEQLTLYCMSKGAQFGLGMALANGAGHANILTNVIAPIANTRIYASEVAEGSLLPEAVSGTVAWLASPACSINGRVLKVADGSVSVMSMVETMTADLGELSQDPKECGKTLENMIGREVT